MTEIRVWAPRATQAAVVSSGRRLEMAEAPGGWFEYDGADLQAGDDYLLSLDAGEPLPDPRSRWQPVGVDGPSRLVDMASFLWTDAGWVCPPLSQQVIYELHVGTFTAGGTFDSTIERLKELVELGVTTIEVMPIAEFSGDFGWGYDGVCLFAPHHIYGGPEGFMRLVDRAHALGLAVVLDVVYNHLGPEGNHLDSFGPYFTERESTPWGSSLNCDGEGSDEVRRFVVDNALMWLGDFHVDGLRLDAVHAIIDVSPLTLMEQLSAAIAELNARSGGAHFLIAEWDRNDPSLVRPRDRHGMGIDAQWNDEFHHAVHVRLTAERFGFLADYGSTDDIVSALRDIYVYAGRYSSVRGRMQGRSAESLAADQAVVFVQNHDQAGNRPRGDRLSALVHHGDVFIAAALLLFAPQVPLLFMGEEWAAGTPFLYFADHRDQQLREAVRRGRATEMRDSFGFDPSEVAMMSDPGDVMTMRCSTLVWEERELEPHAQVLSWYRRLIALRRERGLAATSRDIDATVAAGGSLLRLRRQSTELIANLGEAPQSVTEVGPVLLASVDVATVAGGLLLPPHSCALTAAAVRPGDA